jgi:pimeloyl-ACP methyl ester carboxylesterase
MPAMYRIDVARRLVLSRAWAVFTPQDLFDHFTMLAADPAFDPIFSQLVDLRDVERTELTPPIIRRHALERLFDRTAQRALVVSSPYHYELARIYAAFAEYASQNVRVFRDMHDAEEWLGLETSIVNTMEEEMATTKPAIVLVHGAFADASGWADVIRTLQEKGYEVTAVQNPLSGYADDVATTKRLIDAQKGPVVVVAHSYGGAVMSGAADNPNVKALVYVAAFAPDVGETLGPLLEKYPTRVGEAFRPDAAGFIYLDRATFHDVFAQDLPAVEAKVMGATQKPLHGSVFEAKPSVAAWKSVPTWFIVAKNDRVINPDLERFFAKRMGAKTTEVDASHVAFMSHPDVVVAAVEEAAAVEMAAAR